jgi:hypothetical protein
MKKLLIVVLAGCLPPLFLLSGCRPPVDEEPVPEEVTPPENKPAEEAPEPEAEVVPPKETPSTGAVAARSVEEMKAEVARLAALSPPLPKEPEPSPAEVAAREKAAMEKAAARKAAREKYAHRDFLAEGKPHLSQGFWKEATSEDIIQLRDQGMDINDRGENGWTPVMLAASVSSDPSVVRALYATTDIFTPAEDGTTLLELVQKNEHLRNSGLLAELASWYQNELEAKRAETPDPPVNPAPGEGAPPAE